MSITGKGLLSLRRKDIKEQKSIATGFKKIQFAHKATAGATGFNLASLTLPSEMVGFTNPSPAELAEAQLFFYRKNLTLVSSLRGVLMDYLSYNVNSSQITFIGFTAEEGEIFTGIIDHNARTGVNMVDAAPLVATGDLAIGATDFNVGQLFEINKYSSSQVGAVIVYRNGVQQFRNTGNSSTVLDGNYYEVNNGSGTGQVIRFNTAPTSQTDSILVVSNGLMAYNPDGSALQMIENLSGKIDSMVPTLAAVAGVPESTFGGISNVDLKSFGDSFLNYKTSNDAAVSGIKTGTKDAREFRSGAPSGFGSTNTAIRRFSAPQNAPSFVTYSDSATLGTTFTINEAGLYFLKYSDRFSGPTQAVFGISLNSNQLTTDIFAISEFHRIAVVVTGANAATSPACGVVWLSVGDVVRAHVNPASPPSNTDLAMNFVITQMIKA